MNDLPKGWTEVALGDLAQFINGAAFKQSDWGNTGRRIIRIQNLTDPGKPYNRTERRVKDEILVKPGDLLVSWSATLGVFQWAGPDVAVLNQHIFRVVPKHPALDRRYLSHLLRSTVRSMDRYTHGATMKHINRGEFLGTTVPLPPLEEQRRIAAILDKADELRAKRRAALEQLDSLTQAIFLDMFGDPVQNTMDWDVAHLGAMATNEDAKRVPVSLAVRDAMQGNYPYYGASGIIDQVNDYIFDGQRLLVAEDGANLVARSSAVAFIADGKYWVNNHAHVLADSGVANLRFLEHLIESTDLSPFITGSAQPKLNRANLDRIPLVLPPRERQDTFAERVGRVAIARCSETASDARLDSLFASLQSRAFRGEL